MSENFLKKNGLVTFVIFTLIINVFPAVDPCRFYTEL